MFHSLNLRPLIYSKEYEIRGRSSGRVLASWCPSTSLGVDPDLRTIIAMILVILRGEHLVLDNEGKDVRIICFDMHLLVVLGVPYECHRWCKEEEEEEERRKRNLDFHEMRLGFGFGAEPLTA